MVVEENYPCNKMPLNCNSLWFLDLESYNSVESTVRWIRLGFLTYNVPIPPGRSLRVSTQSQINEKVLSLNVHGQLSLHTYQWIATSVKFWSISIYI